MATMKLKTLKPRLSATVNGRTTSQKRGTAASRGYGYRWQRERLEHLRASPLCVRCQEEGRVTAATVVDHRIPHQGNERLFWSRSNWQSLCAPHHNSEKQREEYAEG